MAHFSKGYLNNKLFIDQALSFDHMGAYRDGTVGGSFPQENGDVLVRLNIRGAEKVSLHVSVSNNISYDLELQHRDGNVFEGTIPFNKSLTGPANVNVFVNGAEVIVPDLPVIWTDNRPQNNIEIPDEDSEYLLCRDVPHGSFTRELLYSKVMGAYERCMVYTPAGYRKEGKALPVLYLLHGGGDNELMWEYVGKMSNTLDNLWADGRAERFIVVMMNDMLRYGGEVKTPVDSAFEEMLITECIPFIEENYEVKSDKWNRAIAGLSMGSYMSCDIAFRHPELFGSLGTFTACMQQEDGFSTYTRPYPEVLRKGAASFEANYRLFWRSTTPQENHLDFFEADDELLKAAGIYNLPCHHRVLYKVETSKWNSWRKGLRDFSQLVFK